jgi:hypothetical protein
LTVDFLVKEIKPCWRDQGCQLFLDTIYQIAT